MAQYIPQESPWSEIGERFAGGVVKGHQQRSDQNALQRSMEGLGEKASPRQILDALTSTKTYSQEAKQNALKNYMGVAEYEQLQQKYNTEQQEKQNKLLKEQIQEQRERNEAKTLLSATGKYNPEQVNEMVDTGGITPVSARSLMAEPELAPYEKKSEQLEAERAHKYIEGVENSAKTAGDDLTALSVMGELDDVGATGFKAQNALADWLESKGIKNMDALRDPASKAYNSIGKRLMTNLGDYVRGKVSNFEFETFKGMLAMASDSPQSAKAIIEGQRLTREMDIKENQIMQEIIREAHANGKATPGNIAYQTEQRFRPIANQMTRQATDRIKNILKPGNKVENMDLNNKLWEEAMK